MSLPLCASERQSGSSLATLTRCARRCACPLFVTHTLCKHYHASTCLRSCTKPSAMVGHADMRILFCCLMYRIADVNPGATDPPTCHCHAWCFKLLRL